MGNVKEDLAQNRRRSGAWYYVLCEIQQQVKPK